MEHRGYLQVKMKEAPVCIHRGFTTLANLFRPRRYCQELRYWRTSSAEYGFAVSSNRFQPVFE